MNLQFNDFKIQDATFNDNQLKYIYFNDVLVWTKNVVEGVNYLIYTKRPAMGGVKSFVEYVDVNNEVHRLENTSVCTAVSPYSDIISAGATKEHMHKEFINGRYLPQTGKHEITLISTPGVIANDPNNTGSFSRTDGGVTTIRYEHLGSYKNSIVEIYQFNEFRPAELKVVKGILVDGSVEDACGEAYTYNSTDMDFTVEGPGHTPTSKTAITCPYFILRGHNKLPKGVTKLFVNGTLVKSATNDSFGEGGIVGIITTDFFKIEDQITEYHWKYIDIYVEEEDGETCIYFDTTPFMM